MDYYNILGVPTDVSPEDLKKAYRKLAMENHPDRTGGDDTKFKQINEAYDNLKDPRKRAMHDHKKTAGAGGFRFDSSTFGNDANPFGDLFGAMRSRPGAYSPHINIKSVIDLSDVFRGKEQIVSYKLNDGSVEQLSINIPKGVKHGMNIRYRGYGNFVHGRNMRGDLILNIAVKDTKDHQRQGNDIHQDLYINALDLMLGCKKDVNTLCGQTIRLNIPQGTKEFNKFKVQGYGLPDFNTHIKGNLIITVIPKITKINDPTQYEALRIIRKQLDITDEK